MGEGLIVAEVFTGVAAIMARAQSWKNWAIGQYPLDKAYLFPVYLLMHTCALIFFLILAHVCINQPPCIDRSAKKGGLLASARGIN
jgi:hypothetical protein